MIPAAVGANRHHCPANTRHARAQRPLSGACRASFASRENRVGIARRRASGKAESISVARRTVFLHDRDRMAGASPVDAEAGGTGFVSSASCDIIRPWRMLAETESFLPASVVVDWRYRHDLGSAHPRFRAQPRQFPGVDRPRHRPIRPEARGAGRADLRAVGRDHAADRVDDRSRDRGGRRGRRRDRGRGRPRRVRPIPRHLGPSQPRAGRAGPPVGAVRHPVDAEPGQPVRRGEPGDARVLAGGSRPPSSVSSRP